MSNGTAAGPHRPVPYGRGPWRHRRRVRVLLWRAALGAAGAVGGLVVTLVVNRFLPLF